ncbi:tRNA (adenosine(37)-N6)-threonylcarbamoyltransferase complex transferase subunit TsaD [bacterium endosymbiont of Pedicinus badii]|uniref:tRNA (adenosine(37)-N6)-threonylcarbamoyltransferase complex transferase subunit TsaD n=1 Tax=bacterium endosymbiont of Pedicinus badii TaxID=1719126 RepID=UPI0009BA712E|nr:tRNA (adenosine(37)-N6)-threonylcarbamoyltransferase complex transferase subunit TsaD [bacterium endosymbiont of Pedicinus badii]OQM34159.1 hypothetical protein AOQ89_02360 [bacterium endosymbiont of Pedicinus badii]
MKILGIETSCDDTGIAVYDEKKKIIINELRKQKIHSKYGGVVPELAAKNHVSNIEFLIKKISLNYKFDLNKIDAIAYTAGPGLLKSLIVGSTFGTSLSYFLDIPLIAINHMEGHLLSPLITKKIDFPFLCLLISGGHTQLVVAKKFGEYKIIGDTLDDAIGEAFDKVANFLGLKYPGGEKISRLAKFGIPKSYSLPIPMIKNKKDMNFSFSGLKTATKNLITSVRITKKVKSNICRSFQETVVKMLLIKCKRAINFTKINRICVSGGVSSNSFLRKSFKSFANETNTKIFFANKEYCTDNAAMIAYAGYLHFKKKKNFQKNLEIFFDPNWSIENSHKNF